jgi:hypothetical protein
MKLHGHGYEVTAIKLLVHSDKLAAPASNKTVQNGLAQAIFEFKATNAIVVVA